MFPYYYFLLFPLFSIICFFLFACLFVCTDVTANNFYSSCCTKFSSYAELLSKKITRGGVETFLNVPEIQLWNSSLLLTALEKLFPKTLLIINASFEKKKTIKLGEMPNSITLRSVLSNEANQRNQFEILKYFYHYWPYLSRMSSEVENLVKNSKIIDAISQNRFFLSSNGFQKLSDILLPRIAITKKTLNYLQNHFPIADIPFEIIENFKLLNISFNELTPNFLREKLKRSVTEHSNVLSGNFDILSSLLHYSCLDMNSNEKQNFKDLAGAYVLTLVAS